MARLAIKATAFLISGTYLIHSQHRVSLEVELDTLNTELIITQQMQLINDSNHNLNSFYFLDWANSFSDKTSPLGQRFAENFEANFHFEREQERGRTTIDSWKISDEAANYQRSEVDQIQLKLPKALKPGDSIETRLIYRVKIPKDKFTRFGRDNSGNIHLKYWWIAPADLQEQWVVYSHKNLDDFQMANTNIELIVNYPSNLVFQTDLMPQKTEVYQNIVKAHFTGTRHDIIPLYWTHEPEFKTYQTEHLTILTDFDLKKDTTNITQFQLNRIDQFLSHELGDLREEILLIGKRQYKRNPFYGLNQLPDFINPYPAGFDQELAFLKIIIDHYLKRELATNLRNEYWIRSGLLIHLMQEYVNRFYPNEKLLGSFSRWPVIRWSRLSKLEFNSQYKLIYLNGARNNVHQSLATPKDELINFNANISNEYLAGVHINLLKQYLGIKIFKNRIRAIFQESKKPLSAERYARILSGPKDDLSWYFDDLIQERTSNDFKIKQIDKQGDSLKVTVLNKGLAKSPVTISSFIGGDLSGKYWTPPFKNKITVTIPHSSSERLVVNENNEVPEINVRNNYKGIDQAYRKPIQLRLIQDIEDPNYRQIFILPAASYNLYDGLSLGLRWYNRTILPKPLHFNLEPQYALNSQSPVGRGSVIYNRWNETSNLFLQRFGIAGNYFSYDQGLFYRRLSPYTIFAFRDNSNLRKNKRQYLTLRSVHVTRDKALAQVDREPNYSVYNLQFNYSDNNLINFYSAAFNAQLSSAFSKVSAQFEYRKLFLNNRQINLRFYAGLFLRNDTPDDDNYFSFALDRPTDYLFDYNYYGRSENSGIYSQQLIIAEGGFKSQLQPAFANQWITTVNSSINLWRWIFIYGDLGLVKNKGDRASVVYDSGIRTSFVTDYFELYFPLWSNLGYEPNLGNYAERIRFIATLDLETLSRLFTRKWY